MPTIEAFNYQGITARDAYTQSVSREQVIAAADAVLGDDPWERIGSLWLIRRASTWSGPDYDSVIVGFAFHELRSGHYVWIARPNALVLAYAQGDPALAEELTAAIAAAEAAGVAPPPQELIDFVHAATTTRSTQSAQ